MRQTSLTVSLLIVAGQPCGRLPPNSCREMRVAPSASERSLDRTITSTSIKLRGRCGQLLAQGLGRERQRQFSQLYHVRALVLFFYNSLAYDFCSARLLFWASRAASTRLCTWSFCR